MTSIPFESVVTEPDQLAQLYHPPHELDARKKIDHVDDGARALIETSPFVLMATADDQGRCTVSPKGGDPGFVTVLDERRLAIPDFAGNNLVDSLRNLLVNPQVGLLFVFPGHSEILRVEGSAWITTDRAVLERCGKNGRRPRIAIGVHVESTFVHCGASFNRGRVWDPTSWEELTVRSAEEVVEGHLALTDPARHDARSTSLA